MITDLPVWINILFLVTCTATVLFFYFANGKPRVMAVVIVLWSIIQSVLAYTGFYHTTDTLPPRFGLVLIPATVLIIYGLLPNQQKWISSKRNVRMSTLSHVVRLPVELVLYGLFLNEMVPELMTFSGRNFDILAGCTAPLIALLFMKGIASSKILIVWNIVGLILVLSILINGILSAELPFQQFAFEQPNRGINYFPFILLPATVVPLVIWTHITDLLILKKIIYEA